MAALALVLLLVPDLAEAQQSGQVVRSHSLGSSAPRQHVDIERGYRDLYAVTEEEGVGYFEGRERRRQRRAFIGHYRTATLRKLRDWSLDLVPGEWSEDESSAVSDGPSSAGVGGRGWAAQLFDQVVNETDVELRYGGGDGLTFFLGRDLDFHGPDWLRGGRVEVNPVNGEMEVDFDLRRTSVTCGIATGGSASVKWRIPF